MTLKSTTTTKLSLLWLFGLLLLVPLSLLGQVDPDSLSSAKSNLPREVSGIVSDRAGLPIPGVNIEEVDASNSTSTDFDGRYRFTLRTNNAVLRFHMMGFQEQRLLVGNQSTINVILEEEVFLEEEEVQVGFGRMKLENLTGAVANINLEEVLGDRPLTHSASSLRGTLAGLYISDTLAQPGFGVLDVNIRGFESINGGEPLILVNNVPMALEEINPQDIENVSVLKDAASASIYGARAAFGVILITTKKGNKNQAVRFDYRNTLSWSRALSLPVKSSTEQFVQALSDFGVSDFWRGQQVSTWQDLLGQYRQNPGQFPSGSTEVDGTMYPLTEEFDVLGNFIGQRGFHQIHNFVVSGGSRRSAYRISFAYNDEQGVMVSNRDSYTRFNINSSLSSDLAEWATATLSFFYKNGRRKEPITSYRSAFKSYSFDVDGFHQLDDGSVLPYDTPGNQVVYNTPTERFSNNLRAFSRIELKPMDRLHIIGEYTFEYNTDKVESGNNQTQYISFQRFVPASTDPSRTFYRYESGLSQYNVLNLYSYWDKEWNSGHYLRALLGFNYENFTDETVWTQRNNLIDPSIPSLSGGIGPLSSEDSYGEWAVNGFFARLNYNYAQRYFLEFNGRFDGSSRFPKGDRYGFFPSLSLGWNLSNEVFWPDVAQVDLLKLRGSWGEVGNQNTGNDLYPAIASMPSVNSNWIDPATGLRLVTLESPSLVSSSFTWERVRMLDLGLDLGMFNDRFALSFDYYVRNTFDILDRGLDLPAVLGTDPPRQNVADLTTRGWELQLGWRDEPNEKFKYRVSFNLSDYRSRINAVRNDAGLVDELYSGKRIGEIWGYVSDGFFEVDDFVDGSLDDNLEGGTLKQGIPAIQGISVNPGDMKFRDLDGDGIIFSGENTLDAPGDRKIIGNTTPRYHFGLNLGVEYLGIDLFTIFSGVGKRDLWLDGALVFPFKDEFSNVYRHQLNYWTPQRTNTYLPRIYDQGLGNYPSSQRVQTKYLFNASYLLWQNLTLGYSLPLVLVEKWRLQKLRFFIGVENLALWDDMPTGLDPLRGNSQSYPFMRKYSCGINLSF